MIIGLGRYLLTTTSRTREEIPDTSGVDGQPDRSGTSLVTTPITHPKTWMPK